MRAQDTVEAFAWRWFEGVVEPSNCDPRSIRRVLNKDVIPATVAPGVRMLRRIMHSAA